jgi:YbbR domain-containing protein
VPRLRTRHPLSILLLENWGYKLVALVCALIFFYSFKTERMGTRTISTDIIAIMESPSEDHILVSQFPPQVAMKLEGPMSVLKSLKGEDVGPLVIPISDFRSKIFSFDESVIETLPKSVNVVKFYPDAIPLRFERRIEKKVPVEASLEGSPAPGRLLKLPVVISPERVIVRGAESSMKKIEKWETQSIFVDALAPGVNELTVNLSPPRIPHITLDEEEVTVKLEISYKMMDRWFRNMPVVVEDQEMAKSVLIKPPKVSVLLSGPEEFVKLLEEDQLYFFVDVTADELQEGGSFQKEIKFSALPEKTAPTKMIPAKVTVVVKASP